jgi:hypothetical protein
MAWRLQSSTQGVSKRAIWWRKVMHMDVGSKHLTNFPDIQFRKKRLTVAIHAQFDMERAEDVNAVKQRVSESVERLAEEGRAKVTFTLSDV